MPSSSVAYSTFSWPGLLKHLRQMLISNSRMEEGKFGQDGINVGIRACLIKMSLKTLRRGISGKLWNTFFVCPASGIDWQVHPPAGAERGRSVAGSSFNTSLANLLVLRGKDVFSAETGQSRRQKHLT